MMQIIYTVPVAEDAYLAGKTDTEGTSLMVGRLETEAHRWMQENYPDVKFETQRAVNPSDNGSHSQILANTAEEQTQVREILRALDDHLHKTLMIRYPKTS
jgi:hypothetical protein